MLQSSINNSEIIKVLVYGKVGNGRRALIARFCEESFREDAFKLLTNTYTTARSFKKNAEAKDDTSRIKFIFTSKEASESLTPSKEFLETDFSIIIVTMDMSQTGCVAALKQDMIACKTLYPNAQLLPVGTKSDRRVITPVALKTLLEDITLTETSAKTGDGVLTTLLDELRLRAKYVLTVPNDKETACTIL